MSPEDVDQQLQCDPLDLVVEALLPGSSLRPLLADVGAAGLVALMQVEVNPQGETPATEPERRRVRMGRVQGERRQICV